MTELIRKTPEQLAESRRLHGRMAFQSWSGWDWNREPEPRSPYTCLTAAFMEWMPLYGPTVGAPVEFWAHSQTGFDS